MGWPRYVIAALLSITENILSGYAQSGEPNQRHVPGVADVQEVKKEQAIERKRQETNLFIANLEVGFPE